VRIEVRAFGGLAERLGASRIALELPEGADVGALRAEIARAHPSVAPLLGSVSVAVDLEVCGDATALSPEREVALLPPVAGGADAAPTVVTGLSDSGIDVDATLARIGASDVGGTVVFLGTVRDHADDLTGVVRLDYSAYPAMAERELARIADETLAGHPEVRGLALVHALGELPVGAPTILIAAACAHRDEAFAACRWALEEVKARVPVFKREVTADGTHRWVGLTPDDVVDRTDA
jgi:molybdopterin synthase catalytic subunit